MYAKLMNNRPVYAPNPILRNGVRIGNPPPALYLAQGYLPVRFTEQPEPRGTGWYDIEWTQTEEAILQDWVWHEASDEDEISAADAVDILLGGEA